MVVSPSDVDGGGDNRGRPRERNERRILRYFFFEYVAYLILGAFVVTLLFAVFALWIILREGASILGRLAHGVTHGARILVARQTELIRSGLSAVGFGLKLKKHEEVTVSRRLPCSKW